MNKEVRTGDIDLDNKEMQQALQIIQFTRRSLFLTGKAGTGKSTFLRYVASHTRKKHVILAPTGIAAINAGGVTLHSFFKLPFHPLVPEDERYAPRQIRSTLKYNSEKIKIIRELELIIIDEISMVRADIIDFIDKVLRIYSGRMREPFGGKQLLLVGDVFQLEPVVKPEDRELLQPHYPSAYFFHAQAFATLPLVSIELRKIYRQNDSTFISILDHLRLSQTTDDDLARINARVAPPPASEESSMEELTITLSTRRDTVDFINNQRLAHLTGKSQVFEGSVEGEFPESSLPTPRQLELKLGAQVLFVKNDAEHRWVNGTLATVVALDEEEGEQVYVRTEEGKEWAVSRERWSNMRYTYNAKERKIEEEEIGAYTQFPLRLAWAITVHKSQGLTFNHVHIDFTGGVFAGGQAYVALSRCKSLEGITLREPLRRTDFFVRGEVIQFATHYNDANAIATALKQSRADQSYFEAVSAFDSGDMEKALDAFFTAIHSRYDIEKPVARRFIRRKLNVVNRLKKQLEELQQQAKQREETLKRLAVEYLVMGKECEQEHMMDAAKRNYLKALELCSDFPEAQRRLDSLTTVPSYQKSKRGRGNKS